jgi:hypothetical protein
MKRYALALFAVLGLALTGLLPSTAQAAITCTLTNTSGPPPYVGWPYTSAVTGCTGTTNLTTMQTGLYAVVSHYYKVVGTTQTWKGPFLAALTPRVFLFHIPADYATFISGTNCPALPANVFGITFLAPTCTLTGNAPYTVVLEYSDNSAKAAFQNNWINRTAAHEMGHWIDSFILGTVAHPYSSTTIWQDVMMGVGVKGDVPVFNALAACTGYHLFSGRDIRNPPSGYWICANNGAGPGLSATAPPTPTYSTYTTNYNVVVAAVPGYFTAAELFAEETAFSTGSVSLNGSIDGYFVNTQWQCTLNLTNSMLLYGVPPGTSPSLYTVLSYCPAS